MKSVGLVLLVSGLLMGCGNEKGKGGPGGGSGGMTGTWQLTSYQGTAFDPNLLNERITFDNGLLRGARLFNVTGDNSCETNYRVDGSRITLTTPCNANRSIYDITKHTAQELELRFPIGGYTFGFRRVP